MDLVTGISYVIHVQHQPMSLHDIHGNWQAEGQSQKKKKGGVGVDVRRIATK